MTSDIIGLSGYSTAGKDEAAKALVEHGYTRIAFADVLRDMAYAIDPYIDVSDGPHEYEFGRLSGLIDRYGWDQAKNDFPDVRRLLQRLGTEAGRKILGENIWIETAFSRAASSNIVVTDVRFPNEADAIRSRAGVVVRITRNGVGPRNDHASELALVDYPFDYYIENNGTIEDLHAKVVRTLLPARAEQ